MKAVTSLNEIRLLFFAGALLGFVGLLTPARAANIALSGTINTDDAVQLFDFSVATTGSVDLRSYGYAGGTTSTGTVVPGGGFDTILTLFNASGAFLSENDDGAGVATDPTTGLAGDARITQNLAAGSYILALTEYDNFSQGNLADGFTEMGNPNFTANTNFTSGGACPGNMFRDISGTAGRCRNGNWAVDFLNVAGVTPTTPVPEPSAIFFVAAGLALLCALRSRKRRKANVLGITGLAALASMPLHAQTTPCPPVSSGPDYCNTTDFTAGQRTLVNITDLQIAAYNLQFGDVYTYPITTANSQQFDGTTQRNVLRADESPLKAYSARMFNSPQAQVVTAVHNSQFLTGAGRLAILVTNSPGQAPQEFYFAAGDDPKVLSGVAADFTGDGFDEVAMTLDDGRLVILSANDVNNPLGGIRMPATATEKIQALTAGDFNEDGRRELAGLVATDNGGLKLVIYSVDPNTLLVSPAASLTLTTPDSSTLDPTRTWSIASGRFNRTNHDQLAIAFARSGGPGYVEVVDFDPKTLNGHEHAAAVPNGLPISAGFVQIATGQFALTQGNTFDQIAYLNASPVNLGRSLEILKVDPNTLVISGNPAVPFSQFGCAYGISVGDFDHRTASGDYNPNAQVALLYGDCSPGATLALNIYSFDDTTFVPTAESARALPDLHQTGNNVVNVALVATDIQGRSISLGDPTKITISSTRQPTVVVGVPPMHVDFVDPGDGKGIRVFNVSAVPDAFKTTYQQQDDSGYDSSTMNSTSWSFGAKESFSGGYNLGNPMVTGNGSKIKDTFTAAQNLKGASGNTHSTYSNKTFNLSTTTGFGDQVTYVDSQLNIWVYPLIAQTACTDEGTSSSPCEQKPLTIQFSAPNGDAQTQVAQGQALQWYQPPWEPGNIFSYPATLDQLKSHYPDLAEQTEPLVLLTDTSTGTVQTTWKVKTTDTPYTSLDQNYSFENDFSAQGSFGVPLASINYGVDINISGSFGFSNLTNHTTTLGKSLGVQVSKPGTFKPFQNYGYSFSPYLMGTTQPGGVVDNNPLSGDVKTFGLLRAMYTADPLTSTSGGWWQQAYKQAPDVALNHPSRWQFTDTPQNGNLDSCISKDCAMLTQRSPDNPALSTFHQLRGFFISSNAFPGQGPQLETAKAGDVLNLQARVYNYSLAEMPIDSTVHVRFYFTPWDPGNGRAAGPSVLINEETSSPIPPFSDATDAQLNWKLIGTTFDTGKFEETKSGNVNIVFWVLVWMQGQKGQILGEMPGHGLNPSLSSIPATLRSFEDAAQLEECQTDGNCYSNNLGFYKQAFYIAGHSLGGVSPGPLPPNPSLDLGKLDVSASQMTPEGNVVLSTMLTANGAPTSAITVKFYDGDPQNGGQMFDEERISYIDSNAGYKVQTPYQTNACGVHQLYAVVNQGRPDEIVRRGHPVRVDCSNR